MNIDALVRNNVKMMSTYSSARDDYNGGANKNLIYLDANESPFDNGINRYPDNKHTELKKVISNIKNINVNQIVFFLISNKKQVFADIPFVTIRIYEGTPDRVDKVLETLYVSSLPEFAGKTSAIMGKFYRVNGEWKYNNIGHPTSDTDTNQVVQKILNIYA